MIALVRVVTFPSIWLGSMLKVSGRMSTKTGLAPSLEMDPTVAKNVKGTVITSSPDPTPSAINANKSASLPDATPTACDAPI